jgi:hypothetical protein
MKYLLYILTVWMYEFKYSNVHTVLREHTWKQNTRERHMIFIRTLVTLQATVMVICTLVTVHDDCVVVRTLVTANNCRESGL